MPQILSFSFHPPDVKKGETEREASPHHIWAKTEEVWASGTNLNQLCMAGPEQTYFDGDDPKPQGDVSSLSCSPSAARTWNDYSSPHIHTGSKTDWGSLPGGGTFLRLVLATTLDVAVVSLCRCVLCLRVIPGKPWLLCLGPLRGDVGGTAPALLQEGPHLCSTPSEAT